MKKRALIFPGQGSQIVGMGKDFYENFTSAREVFQQVDDILKFKLSHLIFNSENDNLSKTENTQPALMAVSIAIIAVLENDFDIKVQNISQYVSGHSLGEYSALCSAKAMDITTAAILLKFRGKYMSECAKKYPGIMIAVIGSKIEEINDIINSLPSAEENDICQVANDNSSNQIVVSGNRNLVFEFIKLAKARGVKRIITLPVSGAFHSDLMKEAQDKMEAILDEVKIVPPLVPVIANVTSLPTSNPSEIKEFLIKQITSKVRWRETMLFMKENGISEIVEIGSGKVLSSLVKRSVSNIDSLSVSNIADLENFVSKI